MFQLNLPQYDFRIKRSSKGFLIFDTYRRRYVALTPEEWVRQNFLRFLTEEKAYPAARFSVEQALKVNGMAKRCDAVLFDKNANACLILEFKAPHVAISQKVFDQVAVYNYQLKVRYFMLSNGLEHYACCMDELTGRYRFLPEIPSHASLLGW